MLLGMPKDSLRGVKTTLRGVDPELPIKESLPEELQSHEVVDSTYVESCLLTINRGSFLRKKRHQLNPQASSDMLRLMLR